MSNRIYYNINNPQLIRHYEFGGLLCNCFPRCGPKCPNFKTEDPPPEYEFHFTLDDGRKVVGKFLGPVKWEIQDGKA